YCKRGSYVEHAGRLALLRGSTMLKDRGFQVGRMSTFASVAKKKAAIRSWKLEGMENIYLHISSIKLRGLVYVKVLSTNWQNGHWPALSRTCFNYRNLRVFYRYIGDSYMWFFFVFDAKLPKPLFSVFKQY